ATGASVVHAFLYSGGSMHDLGLDQGAFESDAVGINTSGQVIVNDYYRNGNTANVSAFLYDNGMMHNLGGLGFAKDIASGINEQGQVVGTSVLFNGSTAFLYSGGVLSDLNSFLSPGSGWHLDGATGINDAGQIIGIGHNPQGQLHAFLLTPQAVP